jgi:site-specific recombinase XerD
MHARAAGSSDGASGASVAAWVKELQSDHSAPGVKQQLAAVRMLFDWLVTGQVVPMNPAAAVRGPKHVVKTGKTPVLEAAEWRRLIDSIPTETVRDLRDRALIATLTYSFARITAALRMKVEDLRPQGASWQLRLHEKGGKEHAMPCHHALAEALRAYIDAAGIADDRKGWLFRSGHGSSRISYPSSRMAFSVAKMIGLNDDSTMLYRNVVVNR